MADNPDLVVGLVTHPRSRFRASGEKTMQVVIEEARRAGLVCEAVISDRNDADETRYPIDRSAIAASARHQARVEERWRRYIGRPWGGALLDHALTFAMTARRSFAAPEGLTRLLNIDLSHLHIWRTALSRGARVALVLEDDALLTAADVGTLLMDVIAQVADADVMVNLSASIDPRALGVEAALREAPVRAVRDDHHLRMPARSITNTVCANLYSATFLRGLVAHVDHGRLIPVLPIDWRVNAYLMDHPQAATWWLEPPPFRQGSMHA